MLTFSFGPSSKTKLASALRDYAAAVYDVGQQLVKEAGTPEKSWALTGRLVKSKSGWILLEVPNALVYGVFSQLAEPGLELPPGSSGRPFNAHISVMRPEELEAAGINEIQETGKRFAYQLGPIETVVPGGWDDMSRVWYIRVHSPELQQLRKSYGLTPLPRNNDYQFHITVAVRRKKVLQNNEVSKAAADADPDVYLIRGNPAVMKPHQADYDAFYAQVQKAITDLGKTVQTFESDPYTAPPGGKNWIAHSRGRDRIRFAPAGVNTLVLDDYETDDGPAPELADGPGPEHYTFNDKMRTAVTDLLDGGKAAMDLAGLFQRNKLPAALELIAGGNDGDQGTVGSLCSA